MVALDTCLVSDIALDCRDAMMAKSQETPLREPQLNQTIRAMISCPRAKERAEKWKKSLRRTAGPQCKNIIRATREKMVYTEDGQRLKMLQGETAKKWVFQNKECH